MTDMQTDVAHFLQQGVAAARSGDRAMARQYLTKVLQAAPDNLQGWLWLGAVAEKPADRITCLQRALALDPNNAAAQRGLAEAQAQETASLLRAGQAAAAVGEYVCARELLLQVVARDESNLAAWEMLSRIMDDPADQEVALENVLTLAPHHAEARRKLDILRESREAAEENVWGAISTDEEAPRESPTLAAAVLGDEFVQQHTTIILEPEPEPESPAAALWAKYNDELLCPYCAAHTEFDNRRCASCGKPLWVKIRRRQEPSIWFWILFSLQALGTVFVLALPFIFLVGLSVLSGMTYSDVSSVYMGDAGALPPAAVQTVLTLLPRPLFFLLWLPFVLSAAMLVALYLRWPPVYYLMLAGSVLEFLGSLLGLVFNLSNGGVAVISGFIGAFISLAELLIMLQLEDDFRFDRKRVLFQVDTGIKNGVGFLLQGRRYAAGHLWGLAALHFQRAAAMLPSQTDGYISLALACIHLKDYDLARYTLEDARRINPQEKRIAEVLALLEQKQTETH